MEKSLPCGSFFDIFNVYVLVSKVCQFHYQYFLMGEQKGISMETWYYTVVSIDGDYANLKRTDIESEDLKLVARALLPEGISEGSQLKYEFMQYTLV